MRLVFALPLFVLAVRRLFCPVAAQGGGAYRARCRGEFWREIQFKLIQPVQPSITTVDDRLFLALQRLNVTESGDHNVVVAFDSGPNFLELAYTVSCYVRDPTAGPVTCGSVSSSGLEASGTASGTLPRAYSQVVANVTGLESDTQFDCLVEASLSQPRITKCQSAGNISTTSGPGDWRLGDEGDDCDTVCGETDGDLSCNVDGMRQVTSIEMALHVADLLNVPPEKLETPSDMEFFDVPGYFPETSQYKVW